jgi:hypothetical protein
MELEKIEDEARFHFEQFNPDVKEMEYGIGNVLDPAADLRKGANLPRGAYVTTASRFAAEGPSREQGLRGLIKSSRLVMAPRGPEILAARGNRKALAEEGAKTIDALIKFVVEGRNR